ncbi:MAG TPA: outer membrane beta-barrel protein [Sphingomicrobium sp.]
MRAFVLVGASAVALVVGSPALASQPVSEEAPPPTQDSRTTVYDAAFFSQYAPRTALDIVQRIPGFTLNLGNSSASTGVDIRGFAGTAGNVVINGARPSTKSETLDVLLNRIPASRVIRVEVGPGDLFGADYSSKTQVANLILKEGGGIAGNATVAAERHYTGRITPNANGSISFSKGPSTFNIAGDTARGDFTETGPDVVTDADGNLIENRDKTNFTYENSPFVSASWALDKGPTNSANLNARYHYDHFILHQTNHVEPADGDARDDRLVEDYPLKIFELGGDVTKPLGGGAIKLVGLVNRQKRHTLDEYDFGNLGHTVVSGGNQQLSDSQRNETLGRLTWTKSNLLGFQFETGGEVAWNTLDDNLELFEFDETGEKTRIDLPIDNARVTELRGEFWVNAGRPLSKTVRMDLGLNYEMSHLKVSGDATADRKLKFLKPSMTLDWTPKGGWHLQAIVRRTVAQLDFYDFISAADLASGQVSGGNADLQPQRTWEGRFSVEHPLFGQGQARLELGYNLISLLQDRILTPEGFDAPGNIGTGKQAYADLTLDAPLDRFWKGLRVKLHGNIQRTRVEDPISGELRDFSGFFPRWEWDADIRRDIGKWAYGFTFSDNAQTTIFGTDVLDIRYSQGPFGQAFIEYRPTAKQTVTLSLNNITNSGGSRDLVFFDPNRRDGPADVFDHRFRNSHVRVGLTFKQSFGGAGAAKVANPEGSD